MKWGRKTSSPPSFGSSVITRVFPGSWFSKFKQTGGGSLDTTSGKKQRRGKLDFSTGNSALPKDGRFYSLDNDAYWTLSFRKDRGEGKRRNKSGRINPLWYESDDEYLVAVSNFKGSGLRKSQLPRKDLEGISELDTEEMKQEGCSNNILQENGASGKKKHNRRSRKLRSRVGRKKKKAEFRTGLDEGENESSNPEEEEQEVFLTKLQTIDEVNEESQDSSVTNSRNHQNTSCHSFSPSSDGEDYATSERISTLKCQNLENTRVEEYYEEAKYQEESSYISKRSRSKKIKKKARGSRSECRIQALADMKKARMKLKKEKKEEVIGSPTIYNSFAVMKSSFNPQQDFKDSMMEMIKEKGITHREELEELLACYLTLNSDEHHHLIINVFQQVWFELNRVIY